MQTFNLIYAKPLMTMLRIIFASLLLSIGSSSLYAGPLSFATPPTIEDAYFALSTRATSDSIKPINIKASCRDCPKSLNLTDRSSIKTRESGKVLTMNELNEGRSYNAIYISYDPNTMNVFRILLK